MKVSVLVATAALAFGHAAPALSQSTGQQMDHSSMSKTNMSSADMNMMMSCKRMSKTAMMKNKRCSEMMKMHPSLMAMSQADMKKMSSCMKMTQKAMMADKRCASMMKMHHADMMKSS